MIDKNQAQAVLAKLKNLFPGVMAGISKNGDNYTVAVRAPDSGSLPENLPNNMDNVSILTESVGPITPQETIS